MVDNTDTTTFATQDEQNSAVGAAPARPLGTTPPTVPATEAKPGASDGAVMNTAVETGTRKGGAPKNNGNRLVHALYSTPEKQSYRLVFGMLPKLLADAEDDAYQYRAFLEGGVFETHGQISRTMAHRVDTATRWYRHTLVCQRLMRTVEEDQTLTEAQRRDAYERLSEKTCKAAESRDRAVALLDLDKSTRSIWDDYYAGRTQPAITRDIGTQPDQKPDQAADASNAAVDREGGNRG